MGQGLVTTDNSKAAIIERVMIEGDLSRLTPQERTAYYMRTCESLGLNPMTKPFEYITLNGKMTLYARKDCTDQLRNIHRVSITKLERDVTEDIYAVTAYAVLPDGRMDSSIGAVSVAGLRADALANAMMKAETKAKRRVTLSICGLGMLDETELETIPDTAKRVETIISTTTETKAEPPTLAEMMASAQAMLDNPPKSLTKEQKSIVFANWDTVTKLGIEHGIMSAPPADRSRFSEYLDDIVKIGAAIQAAIAEDAAAMPKKAVA